MTGLPGPVGEDTGEDTRKEIRKPPRILDAAAASSPSILDGDRDRLRGRPQDGRANPDPAMPRSVTVSAPAPSPDRLPLTFLVGRSAEGHWLAVETHGLGGGLFRTCRDALHYAAAETGRRPDAVRLADTTLTLAP